jgi:hypothetical protein
MWCQKSQVVIPYLEGLYLQPLSDEIIAIRDVAIFHNKPQINARYRMRTVR